MLHENCMLLMANEKYMLQLCVMYNTCTTDTQHTYNALMSHDK